MNEVIRKCVLELSKEEPRLDYVRGMLDTLLSMNAPALPDLHAGILITPSTTGLGSTTGTVQLDEVAMMEAPVKEMMKSMPPVTLE